MKSVFEKNKSKLYFILYAHDKISQYKKRLKYKFDRLYTRASY